MVVQHEDECGMGLVKSSCITVYFWLLTVTWFAVVQAGPVCQGRAEREEWSGQELSLAVVMVESMSASLNMMRKQRGGGWGIVLPWRTSQLSGNLTRYTYSLFPVGEKTSQEMIHSLMLVESATFKLTVIWSTG